MDQISDAFVRDEVGKTVAVLTAVLADAALMDGVARAAALGIASLR